MKLHQIITEEQFWAKVDRSGGPDACWPWTANRLAQGYGRFWSDGKSCKSHRAAWEFVNGQIPDGMCICHSCDNPPCCNPAHLWLGTNRDNIADRDRKGRTAKGDRTRSRLYPESLPRGDEHWCRLHPERIVRGAARRNAVLTDDDVRRIRGLAGVISQDKIAARLGVSQATVSQIIRRKTWSHVQ